MKNQVNFWHLNEKRNFARDFLKLESEVLDYEVVCEINNYLNKDFYVVEGKILSFKNKEKAEAVRYTETEIPEINASRFNYNSAGINSLFDGKEFNTLIKKYADMEVPSLKAELKFLHEDLSFQASYIRKDDDRILTTKKFNQDFIFSDDYKKRPKLSLSDESAAELCSEYLWQIVIDINQDSLIYGLGDLMTPLNKREYQFIMWNTDDPCIQLENRSSLYKSIPIIYIIDKKSFEVFTIFFDNSSRAKIDLAMTHKDKIVYSLEDESFSLYINHSNNIKEAYLKIVDLLGVNNLPKRNILGYQQSRWSYYSDNMLDELIEKFAEFKIPVSAINLDIDYMDGFRNFTYDRKRFSSLSSTAENLQKKHIDLITIIDAGLKYDPGYFAYSEARDLDILLPGEKRSERSAKAGAVNRLTENDYKDLADLESKLYLEDGGINTEVLQEIKDYFYLGWVWPGQTVFPDFEQEKCRAWWKEKIKDFVSENKISGIWLDMNEPANFNGDIPDYITTLSRDKNRDCSICHKNWHNRFANQMSLATYEGLVEAKPESRAFVFSRAAYAGIQKFAGVWTGDSSSIWSQLRMQLCQMLSLSFCGINLLSADIAGFIGNTNKELYIRWLELAVFYPFVRNHSEINSSYQEPWTFDEDTVNISRDLIELRYRLLPYIYDAMIEAEVGNKLPLMRQMAFEYPEDENCYSINDQFFFASDILVAPVLDPCTRVRAVYLPRGEWYNFHSNEYHDIKEGGYILAEAKYGKPVMFVKATGILPLAKRDKTDINSTDTEDLIVKTYPSKHCDNQNRTYKHYLDSGDGFAYREKKTTEYIFYWQNGSVKYEEKIGVENLKYKSVEVEEI